MLEKVTNKIDEIIGEINNKHVSELFAQVSGGKMLRPRLMLKISQNERIYELAAIVELIHIASLLHDDVIDASLLRRKKPTVNATDGDRVAVMLGDVLYSKAFSKLVSFEPCIAKKISDAVTTLSLGEMEDVEMSKELNIDEDRYIKMLYGKTGALIEAAAVSAAMLEGIAHEDIEIYAKSLGKRPFSDFTEGKSTAPYIHLYKNGDEVTKEFLKSIYKKRVNDEQKEKLMQEFHKRGSIEYSLSLAKNVTQQGLSALHASSVDEALKIALTDTAKKQLSRLF